MSFHLDEQIINDLCQGKKGHMKIFLFNLRAKLTEEVQLRGKTKVFSIDHSMDLRLAQARLFAQNSDEVFVSARGFHHSFQLLEKVLLGQRQRLVGRTRSAPFHFSARFIVERRRCPCLFDEEARRKPMDRTSRPWTMPTRASWTCQQCSASQCDERDCLK